MLWGIRPYRFIPECKWATTKTYYTPSGSSVTVRPPHKLSSANYLVCFNFQSGSILLKDRENVVWVSNSLDPVQMESYSPSHPDPSCFHSYGSIVVLGGLRVKSFDIVDLLNLVALDEWFISYFKTAQCYIV